MRQPDMAEHLRYYLSIASRVGHFKRKDPQDAMGQHVKICNASLYPRGFLTRVIHAVLTDVFCHKNGES